MGDIYILKPFMVLENCNSYFYGKSCYDKRICIEVDTENENNMKVINFLSSNYPVFNIYIEHLNITIISAYLFEFIFNDDIENKINIKWRQFNIKENDYPKEVISYLRKKNINNILENND